MDNYNNLTEQISALWKRFETWEIPVHSLLASGRDRLLWETYLPPYRADTLHRMFSITKSYCSLAIGCLAAEGKLTLDDPIIRYFPEYLPAGQTVPPYLAGMTIRHMLTMQTCHSSTTYKLHPEQNWVESFFITPPSHKSGEIFLYDSSASHTLAALVKKLSGTGVLDYLRHGILAGTGFSREAYIMQDPFGTEMGGSGLMALPMDLMITAQYIMKQLRNGTGTFAGYLREALRCQVPTIHSGQCLDEQQGYGYQFWKIRNGSAMYGMGGQYVLFYPESDLILVITADSQNIKGGTQKILDAVHETLAPYCTPAKDCKPASGSKPVFPAVPQPDPAGGTFRLHPNEGGFTELILTTDSDGGTLILNHSDAIFRIPFGRNNQIRTAVIDKYNQPVASSGTWLDRQTLYIYSQLCGESVGSLSFMIRLRPDGATLWMKKIEETIFHEFCGFAEGVRQNEAATV